jgi:hypothetical protein
MPITMTQANRFMGWPLPIPINYEWQITRLAVNPWVGGPMAMQYWLTLKYPY